MKVLSRPITILSLASLLVLQVQAQSPLSKDFSKVRVKNIYGTLHLMQGHVNEIVLEGPNEALRSIETRILNGRLIILSKSEDSDLLEGVNIFVTSPEFTHISLTGQGDILSKNTLKTKRMELSHSGTGIMKIGCKSSELIVSQSGKGTIQLRGSIDQFTLSMSGKGDLYARELDIRKCTIGNSSSGICEVLCPYSF